MRSTVVAFWRDAFLSARIPSSLGCLHCVGLQQFGEWERLSERRLLAVHKIWLHPFVLSSGRHLCGSGKGFLQICCTRMRRGILFSQPCVHSVKLEVREDALLSGYGCLCAGGCGYASVFVCLATLLSRYPRWLSWFVGVGLWAQPSRSDCAGCCLASALQLSCNLGMDTRQTGCRDWLWERVRQPRQVHCFGVQGLGRREASPALLCAGVRLE